MECVFIIWQSLNLYERRHTLVNICEIKVNFDSLFLQLYHLILEIWKLWVRNMQIKIFQSIIEWRYTWVVEQFWCSMSKTSFATFAVNVSSTIVLINKINKSLWKKVLKWMKMGFSKVWWKTTSSFLKITFEKSKAYRDFELLIKLMVSIKTKGIRPEY